MAQEHQEYIQQKVNPILENLVTQLLLERPEQLAPFMIKWFSEHAKTPAAAALTENPTINELDTLKGELEKLKDEVKQLEAETGGAQGAELPEVKDKPAADEESEEESEGEDELPPPPAHYLTSAPRASVSAEAYGNWNVKKEFTPPVHAKSDEQKERIKQTLTKSFLFKSLDEKNFDIIIGAMVEKICEKDARIIEQGDDGDCLFVVEEGQMNCFKKQAGGEEKLVKQCYAGDAFGELALLYNTPRAASVVAHERCVLWQLDRETFNHIVRDAASKRREQYEKFLKQVPILETLETYEMQQMCDALQTETHKAGDTIIAQGESGDKFYIIEEGECAAMKVYTSGTPAQEVCKYGPFTYFGELALINNETRAATIVAKTDCKTCSLTGRVFKSLLGPIEDVLKRKSAEYK